MRFGHNIWLEGPIDLDQRVSTAFCKIFSGTPHSTIFGALKYAHKYAHKYAPEYAKYGLWATGLWATGLWATKPLSHKALEPQALEPLWLKGLWLKGRWLKGLWLKGYVAQGPVARGLCGSRALWLKGLWLNFNECSMFHVCRSSAQHPLSTWVPPTIWDLASRGRKAMVCPYMILKWITRPLYKYKSNIKEKLLKSSFCKSRDVFLETSP